MVSETTRDSGIVGDTAGALRAWLRPSVVMLAAPMLVFLAVFVFGAGLAGMAGIVGGTFQSLSPGEDTRFLLASLVVVIVGGMGSIVGSLVGAFVLVVLPQALTVFHDYEQALLGLIVMVFMIFLRRGIVPSLAASFAGWRR